MNKFTIILSALAVGVSSYVINVPTPVLPPEVHNVLDNHTWLNMQKIILLFLENVCEESVNPMIVQWSKEFTFDAVSDFDPDDVKKFQALTNILPKGEIFSEYDQNNFIELKTYFNVMKSAKDFNSFLKAAAWIRQNSNCGIFVDAFYLALQNRKDTLQLHVPAPYEVLPNYFIRKEVIIKVASLLSGFESTLSDDVKFEGNTYTVTANYTDDVNDDDEGKLAYFREDIGLNTHHYLNKLNKLVSTNTNDDMAGEIWFHNMKQLLVRYNLERYSNELQEVEPFCSQCQYTNYYNPLLIYSNGNDFRSFLWNKDSPNSELFAEVERIENEVRAFVASHQQNPMQMSKTEVLNKLKTILSTKSYIDFTKVPTDGPVTSISQKTVLEHYMTELRHPITWKLQKRMFDVVENALNVISPYTRNELYFPGVEITGIDVKKCMTTMENFEIEVTDSLKTNDKETNFQVKVSQPRLNNKPFTVKVTISSLAAQKGLLKIYLGPKMMPGELTERKNQFLLLDTFECNLKIGRNAITRSSNDFKNLADDFISMNYLRKKIEDVEFGLDALPLGNMDNVRNFPSRLLLPKGSVDGFQFFVFIAPVLVPAKPEVFGILSSTKVVNSALLSPGYPLDLNIDQSKLFDLPNCMVKLVSITHKGLDDGVSNYVYDPLNKPTYGVSKPTYNLKSKQEKYGKKPYYKKDFDQTTVTPVTPKTDSTVIIKTVDIAKIIPEPKIEDTTVVPTTTIVGDDEKNVDADEELSKDFHKNIVIDEDMTFDALTYRRNPSVYDYLMPGKIYVYDDDSDEDQKVYE